MDDGRLCEYTRLRAAASAFETGLLTSIWQSQPGATSPLCCAWTIWLTVMAVGMECGLLAGSGHVEEDSTAARSCVPLFFSASDLSMLKHMYYSAMCIVMQWVIICMFRCWLKLCFSLCVLVKCYSSVSTMILHYYPIRSSVVTASVACVARVWAQKCVSVEVQSPSFTIFSADRCILSASKNGCLLPHICSPTHRVCESVCVCVFEHKENVSSSIIHFSLPAELHGR